MANSLYTGVTGLRIHQQMLDVVGNNLANSNTTGFKAQRTRFSDLVYQTLNHATSPTDSSLGGTNPIQIGNGARVAAIDPNLQQGSLEATGRDLDLALEGNGFFVARNGTENIYTRAGAFGVDSDHYLVDPANGFRVQRFGATGEGTPTTPAFQTTGNDDIKIPLGTAIPGNATTSITLQGNLSANALGPLAQTLSTGQPFLSGGTPVTLATLLNNVDDNVVDYIVGDQLRLQGTNVANAAVNVTVGVGPTTTIGDLINAINANFTGSTASLDAAGNIIVTANTTGPNNLNLSLTDVTGNTGASSWGNHGYSAITIGKDGDIARTGIQVYDSQGTAHNVNLIFQKQANNVWDMRAEINPTEGVLLDDFIGSITFGENGSFQQVSGAGLGDDNITVQFNGFTAAQDIQLEFGTPGGFDGLTQVGGTTSAAATGQDGFEAGYFSTLSVGRDGVINGVFTNGRTLPIAQLAIAAFSNPAALNRIGDNYYSLSSESGPPLIGSGLSGGRGAVQQKTLESSNVDVALEFTRLIIAQRGFQVNARMITASDQILQELANILR